MANQAAFPIRHQRKPGWEGEIYENPWSLPDLLDIMWRRSPLDEEGKLIPLPVDPIRYPIKDLTDWRAGEPDKSRALSFR